MKNNEFKKYTDKLADTLQKKNEAYGNSFAKTTDTYGLPVVGIRLMDKYNRIEHLITNHKFSENGESLRDNLLDMAGYSILALKFLDKILDNDVKPDLFVGDPYNNGCRIHKITGDDNADN